MVRLHKELATCIPAHPAETVTDTSQPTSSTSWLSESHCPPLGVEAGRRSLKSIDWQTSSRANMEDVSKGNAAPQCWNEMAAVIIDNYPAAWCSLPNGGILPILVGGSQEHDLYRVVHGNIDLAILVMGAKNVLETKQSYPLLDSSTHLLQNILIEKARDILPCSVGAQALFFRCRRSSLFGGGPCKTP